MVPPIIALVLALGVAFLAFQTSQVDTQMSQPAPAASSMADESDEASAADVEADAEEAPAEAELLELE